MHLPSTRAPLAAIAALLALGCPPPAEAPNEEARPAPDAIAAEIGDASVTLQEVDDWIKEALFRQATRGGDPVKLHEFRKGALDQIIHERLIATEAQARGTDPDSMLRAEIQSRSGIGEEEIKKYYESHAERYEGKSLEEAAPSIRQRLESHSSDAAQIEFLSSLRDKAGVKIHLEPPRVQVSADGPSQGPADAPVTIVEFSDYQCPFCRRAEPTVKQLLERYPEQVRFVYRHFPLDSIHPRARPAAEAAACAGEQGRFWEFHEILFEQPSKFSDEDLERFAKDVGLDVEAFGACRTEGRFRAAVEADVAAGRAAGVTGTPAFFVNGIMLSGARPLDAFVEIIEEELARAGAKAGS